MRGCAKLLRMDTEMVYPGMLAIFAGFLLMTCTHGSDSPGGLCPLMGCALLWPLPGAGRRFRRRREKRMDPEHSQFLAAAETSLDAFCILDSVRDKAGNVRDFRYHYVNRIAEKMMGTPRSEMIGELFCELMPELVANGFFEKIREVANTGEPLRGEQAIGGSGKAPTWVRYQVIRLGDGVAITLSDISETRAGEQRFRKLAEFTDSVFENAPFSIIATDVDGVISAMNLAAERLSGYSREELVGKAPLTLLHDRRELAARAKEMALPSMLAMDGFEVLTAKATEGGTEEQEWTYIRRDGSRTPINLGVRATMQGGELTGFVGIAFDVTERRAMMDYVTHLATHDQLTGLVGRAVLQERIMQAVERARRYGTKVAIFILDLDQFKRINDSLGHWAGDQVLLETAARLRRSVRTSDTVARMGGDEFVVVMDDMTTIADVELCATNLVTRIEPEMVVDGHQLHVTASVGVCVYPDFAGDTRHLLKWADAAMYSAKENGRNQHRIFSHGMLKDNADRLTMERAMRQAVIRNEFRLHYQLQVSLTTGTVVGMEALLRWEHPEMGLLTPAEFMALAEDTGLILPIGEWAFRTACVDGRALRDELGMDLTVSVNLSPRQFQQKNLLEVVEGALRDSGLPPKNLEIEITENTLMLNSTENLEKLQRIRSLGGRIAIDDFGTGFCNFTYLLQYEVDRLKIDQGFIKLAVTDANAAAVVRTIIAMSHGLSIKVIAEGVETEEQMRFLLRRRCDEAQGYFLAKPVPRSEFAQAVRGCCAMGMLQSA